MSSGLISQAERRREPRVVPAGHIRVSQIMPVLPLSDAEVLNVSTQGVALRTPVPVFVGQRLSFTNGVNNAPPILAEVLACDAQENGWFHVRCRCLLGGFDID